MSINPELQRRLASIERRITKLESDTEEFDKVVDPQGWIGEAFEVLEAHVDSRMDAIEAKLDTILLHMTGMK